MQHYYDTKEMENRLAGGDYSTANGAWVDGERIIFGDITVPAGTGAEPHSHPNEQFIIVLSGRAHFVIDGDEKTVGPGEIVHIPAETIHSTKVVGDEDLHFITAKDTSWGIVGTKADV